MAARGVGGVRARGLEQEAARAMLAWPHSEFGAHVGPPLAGDDRESLLRVARYGALASAPESRLRYHAERAEVELISDARAGPYVGVHRLAALEFLARWVDHVPERYETRVRYYGAYASRRRVWWCRRGVVLVPTPAREPRPRSPVRTGPRCGAAGPSCCGGCFRWRSRCAPAAAARCGSSRSSPLLGERMPSLLSHAWAGTTSHGHIPRNALSSNLIADLVKGHSSHLGRLLGDTRREDCARTLGPRSRCPIRPHASGRPGPRWGSARWRGPPGPYDALSL